MDKQPSGTCGRIEWPLKASTGKGDYLALFVVVALPLANVRNSLGTSLEQYAHETDALFAMSRLI